MLFFFRRSDIPDGSQLVLNVTGDTDKVAQVCTMSVDQNPSAPLDPTQPLSLQSPHAYAVELDITALAAATVTIDVSVTASGGVRVGVPFQQEITAAANDLNTIRCDLATEN